MFLNERLILLRLKELYIEFKKTYRNYKIGFSKFCELRPKLCITVNSSGTHCVCVCTYHQNAKPVWPNGWVFVYELSGCGFESSCSHLNFKFRACFEQGLPWHSGNYRVWIHPETRTWHDKNIQSKGSSLWGQLYLKVTSHKHFSCVLRTKRFISFFYIATPKRFTTILSAIFISQ